MPETAAPPDTLAGPKLASRTIAEGNGWLLRDITCTAGPDDRAFEERHDSVAISLVAAGSFRYRTDSGTALLHAGSLLLGNAGACFECGHEHGSGDRCISLHLAPGYFEEIAASRAGGSGYRFHQAMLPASLRRLMPLAAGLEALATAGTSLSSARIEEFALQAAEVVLTVASGATPSTAAPSPRDHRRIAAMLRHLEEMSDAPHSLDALAAQAGVSKYHFLRCFRRITGSTPYDYLLSLRLRRAAVRLREGRESIAVIAFEAGFGDLSTFNARFKEVFGKTPKKWGEPSPQSCKNNYSNQ